MATGGFKGLMQLCGVWYNALHYILYPTTHFRVVASYVTSSGACDGTITSSGAQKSYLISSGSSDSYISSV